jgi:hypothetical protein
MSSPSDIQKEEIQKIRFFSHLLSAGDTILSELPALGIDSLEELAKKTPEDLFEKLSQLKGKPLGRECKAVLKSAINAAKLSSLSNS